MSISRVLSTLALGIGLISSTAQAEGTFTTKSLTPELAVKLAQATLEACRAEGSRLLWPWSIRAAMCRR